MSGPTPPDADDGMPYPEEAGGGPPTAGPPLVPPGPLPTPGPPPTAGPPLVPPGPGVDPPYPPTPPAVGPAPWQPPPGPSPTGPIHPPPIGTGANLVGTTNTGTINTGKVTGKDVGIGAGIGCGLSLLAFLLGFALLSAGLTFLGTGIAGVGLLPVLVGVVMLFFPRARGLGVGVLIVSSALWITFIGPCLALLGGFR